MSDLFGWAKENPPNKHYPETAGWKDQTVSRENALRNRDGFTRMQQMVLNLYRTGFVGTADDAADKLALSPFSTRPRCTELVKLGLLARLRVDRSTPGRSAWVLALATSDKEEAAA